MQTTGGSPFFFNLPSIFFTHYYSTHATLFQRPGPSVYYKDICVGVIGCNLESAGAGAAPSGVTAGAGEGGGSGAEGAPAAAPAVEGKRRRVYLTVLAVLAPYRDRGIGSALLKQVLDALAEGKGALADVEELYLHVSEENKEALAFYERAGFTRDAEVVKGYYRKLENPNAVVLRKAIVTAVAASQGMD
jgi:ribosomal protein S18 acetylase RimI-like enzyme